MFVTLKSLLKDEYYDKKFNSLLRYNQHVSFVLKENALTPEVKHDYLKALLEDKAYDDFYRRFKCVSYYLHALNVVVFQKKHLRRALASAQRAEDVCTKTPHYEVNIEELTKTYQPRLRNNCSPKYSVESNGWLASLGGVCGDIAGSRYEFYGVDRSTITFENAITSYSRITDDSVLLLATLSVIADVKKQDKKELLNNDGFCVDLGNTMYSKRYRQYYKRYPSVGYGPGFVRWALEDIGPYHSFGNGSAMRIAPIGEAFDDVNDVIFHAIVSAACTHDHPEGIKGAVVTAVCIWMGRHGYSKEEILEYAKIHYVSQNLITKYTMDEVRSCRQGGYAVACQFSVPTAITCFIESDNYEGCIANALSFEGDSDTIACIAGAIAAAYYGRLSKYVKETVFDRLPNELGELFKEH